MPSLRELILDRNKIRSVEDGCFAGVHSRPVSVPTDTIAETQTHTETPMQTFLMGIVLGALFA